MIDVNQLRKGATFTIDSEIYKVLNYRHHKPGRGKATIRVTVRNMRSGSTTEMTFGSSERVEDIQVEYRSVQYLYDDGEFLTFMDLDTYEQPQVNRSVFGDDTKFLKENMDLKLCTLGDEIIDYILPITMEYEVTEAEAAVAGDTANSPTKKVTLETGLVVTVPLFVNVGDSIKVNIEEESYITRV